VRVKSVVLLDVVIKVCNNVGVHQSALFIWEVKTS